MEPIFIFIYIYIVVIWKWFCCAWPSQLAKRQTLIGSDQLASISKRGLHWGMRCTCMQFHSSLVGTFPKKRSDVMSILDVTSYGGLIHVWVWPNAHMHRPIEREREEREKESRKITMVRPKVNFKMIMKWSEGMNLGRSLHWRVTLSTMRYRCVHSHGYAWGTAKQTVKDISIPPIYLKEEHYL